MADMKPREPRRNVMIKARMRAGGSWSDTCILNLSSRGMLLRSAASPGCGSYLEIRRGNHIFVARVVWSGPDRFGVQTQDYVPVDSLAQNPDRAPPIAPAAVTGVGECRATCRAAQLAHEKSRIAGRIVEFGTFLLVAGFATMLVAGTVVEVLFEPLAQADAALAAR